MKNRMMKRLLVGALVVLMTFNDATGVLATELVETTETVEETVEVENYGSADYESNLMSAAVDNLTYEFVDIDGDAVSTANTTANSIRFVVFEMSESCQLGLPFEDYGYDALFSSEQFQFTWLYYNADSKEAFEADEWSCTRNMIKYMDEHEDANIQEMRNHIALCVNGENLTTEGDTATSDIEAAYAAYWEAAGLTEAGITYDTGWDVIYMISGDNQIVGAYFYRGDESILTTILEDAKRYITSTLAPVENLRVEQGNLGTGAVYFTHPSLNDVDGFYVYRSTDNGTTYTLAETKYLTSDEHAEPEAEIVIGVSIPLDETGNNGDCIFKVKPFDYAGLEGSGATIPFEGSTVIQYPVEDGEYADICFVNENGERISYLDLHVGEAKKIGLALIKKDGTLVHMNEFPYHIYGDLLVQGQFEVDWSVWHAPVGNTSNLNMYSDDWGNCLDWLATEEIIESKEAYFTASSLGETGYQYFIQVRVTCLNEFGVFWLRLPVNVSEAEEGVTYEQPEELKVATTPEEAAQGIRDLMVARDYESVVLASYDIQEFDPWYELMDLYAEREGMKPYEGDYLNFATGERDSVSSIYTYYEWGAISYKGVFFSTFRITVPFITTRTEEDMVDAYIQELVHTEGGELYIGNYDTDEEKVKAIYDFIIGHVNPQVPGDRTTPIYHTVYHALLEPYGGYEGSGTCQAFAMLFTRLSREMGIPSKVIMGVDAAAHAYNIVEVDGKWYYIDTNTKRYLSGSNSFERAEEQYYYLEQAYIDNYLSKIEENDYGFVSGATLTYTDEEGQVITHEVADFAAAVAKINSLAAKRDYTIAINATDATAKAITMPNKKYVDTLTIVGAGTGVTLYLKGNITLTSPTVLKNLTFENTAAYTVSIGNYSLTIDGTVIFDTKVTLSSDKQGSLTVTEAGLLSMEGSLNVATLTNAGEVTADTVKLTNAYLNNGHLYANETIQITNMSLEGQVVLQAQKDFKVTGKLHSATNNAAFYTRQNAKGTPYLNITGTVTLENPSNKIQVGVYAADADVFVKLETGSLLLNAKTATADMFAPVAGNVGNVGEYPAEGGYFLQKIKTGIYVLYGDEAGVALCEGNADTGDLEDAVVIGYFATFADAVAGIEARKDTTAEYTIVLLKDVNSESAPAAVTLPSKAANVVITGLNGEVFNIFYTGNIALKASTEFVKVRFNPMNAKKQGVASNIVAGKFNLTLRDIEVGSKSGMAIKDVSGSASQVTTFATAGLVLSGNTLNSKEIRIEKPLTVKGKIKATTVTIENGTQLDVAGTFTTTNLVMQGYAVLDAADVLTITNIDNNTTENITGTQVNTIYYAKSSNGVSNLTIKGLISGNNETKVELRYDLTEANKADYELVMKSNKYTLNKKQALATVEKAALSEVAFYLGENQLGSQEIVKANKGVYIVDTTTNPNIVMLEANKDGVVTSSYCLDYSQAVNEINNIGDAKAFYAIKVGLLSDSGVTDTNLTDTKAISAITMPKKGKAASVIITSDEKGSIAFSGNISYPGSLVISNVELAPVKDCSITGTKNVSTVVLANTSATFKNISNVKRMLLSSAELVTTGTATITDVVLSGTSRWEALAKTTVTNLDVSASEAGSYLASKQTAKTLIPMFTISGKVTLDAAGTPVAWKVLTPTATVSDLSEVTTYKNVSLVVAPKESADKFVAWPFTKENIAGNTEGVTSDNLISYKSTKNEVANGNKEEMVIRIVRIEQTQEGEIEGAETYAKSFDEAVTIINNLGDATASYRMEVLQSSVDGMLYTTKNGTTLGKMTLPAKAAEVTIVGANEERADKKAVISYTGSLAINCDTTFENIILSEETSDAATISYKGAYELTITDSVRVYEYDSDERMHFASINIPKGKLILSNAKVSVLGNMTVKDVETIGESALTAGAKTTITNISCAEAGAGNETLQLVYLFSTKNATQLTIGGNITNVKLELVPGLYNSETEEYDFVTVDSVANKKLVTMPKASTTDITLQYQNDAGEWQILTGGNLYKQNGGLYYSTETPAVEVVAEDTAGKEVYGSQFLSWEQAVKEVDKRADASLTYYMILKDSIGGEAGAEAPIKTLTLPAKAKEVIVTSEVGEENHIFFTGTKVSLKANTTFENVGLFALKKASAKLGGGYGSVGYSFVTGKYHLCLRDLQYQESDAIRNTISTISGSTKGALTVVLGSEENNNLFAADKISGFGTVSIYNEVQDDAIVENQMESIGRVSKGMSGIGTLNVYPGVTLSCDSGTIVTKNANIYGGTIRAKDITISQIAALESANLIAGSKAATDGKLKLNNIVVEDSANYLSAKLDKKGKSQLNITGTVTASKYYVGPEGESAIEVDLYSKDYSAHVQLFDGMTLMNAAKAEAFWFVPCYTVYDAGEDKVTEGMGYYVEGYGLYKVGKTIKYGAL